MRSVDGRHDIGGPDQALHVLRLEVGHTDGADATVGQQLYETVRCDAPVFETPSRRHLTGPRWRYCFLTGGTT